MALRSATKQFGKYCNASGEHCHEKNEEAVSASPFIDDAAGTVIDHVGINEGFYSFSLFLELPPHGASLGAPSRENINSLKMIGQIYTERCHASPNSLFLYFACSYTKALTTIVNESQLPKPENFDLIKQWVVTQHGCQMLNEHES